MTTAIRPDSDHGERARLFAAALQAARARRGTGTREIAIAAGVSRNLILAYLRGDNIPSVPVAERLATALGSGELLRIAQEARTRSCRRCRKPIIAAIGRPPDYCSPMCRKLAVKRLRGKDEQRIRVLSGAVRAYRARIAEMCAACPDGASGFCASGECPLRSVSPLPLIVHGAHPARPVRRTVTRVAS